MILSRGELVFFLRECFCMRCRTTRYYLCTPTILIINIISPMRTKLIYTPIPPILFFFFLPILSPHSTPVFQNIILNQPFPYCLLVIYLYLLTPVLSFPFICNEHFILSFLFLFYYSFIHQTSQSYFL